MATLEPCAHCGGYLHVPSCPHFGQSYENPQPSMPEIEKLTHDARQEGVKIGYEARLFDTLTPIGELAVAILEGRLKLKARKSDEVVYLNGDPYEKLEYTVVIEKAGEA